MYICKYLYFFKWIFWVPVVYQALGSGYLRIRSVLCKLHCFMLKGSTVHHPQVRSFGAWRWKQSRPADWGKAFYLPLNYLQELERGLIPGRELLPERTVHPRGLSARQGTLLPNLCSSHLPVNFLPPLWSPRPFPLLLSFGWMAYKPQVPGCLWVSYLCGAPICK